MTRSLLGFLYGRIQISLSKFRVQLIISRMGTVNLVVVVESISSAITYQGGDLRKFHLPSIIAVGSALGWFLVPFLSQGFSMISTAVKFLLFLYSFSIRKQSSQVQLLWEDHRNDLFINSFGLLPSPSKL